MPQEKKAGITAKSYNDILGIVKSHSRGLNSNAVKKGVHETLTGKGSGSIAVDALSNLSKKIFGNKNSIESGVSDVRQSLTAKDIKLGKKVYDFLGKRKSNLLNDKAKNLFSYNHKFKAGESIPGQPDKLLEIKVPMLTAPFEKAKGAVLPMVGGMSIASGVSKLTGEENMKKEQSTKYELIEKIGSLYNHDMDPITQEATLQEDVVSSDLIKTASKMLKYAAGENKRLLMENEKLASENQKLQSDITFRAKLDLATKLANEMNQKSLIKKADIDQQIQKIVDMDDTGIEMLKSAVDTMSINIDNSSIDNFAFLGMESISNEDKKTLQDTIEEM